MSTRRRRFPTEFALPFAGIGLGIAGTLGNGGDAVGLLWSLGGALVVLGIYFGILAAFVGVLERRARAAELADPASVQLLGFLTKSGRVAFGLPPSNLVRNIVLIGLTGDSVRVQTRTRSIDVTTPCSSARAIDFDVNEGVIAAGLRFKGGIEIDCGIGTVAHCDHAARAWRDRLHEPCRGRPDPFKARGEYGLLSPSPPDRGSPAKTRRLILSTPMRHRSRGRCHPPASAASRTERLVSNQPNAP
ncbi:hypothetical protein [Curtobacterium flaccumfaciens]|uniref:hypothetical protein n=1 Tax=Curtobacterium flaccumfaciens TaxID=2035 RepID=UPI001BE117E3|nr:hypothetical protein [Curtobacterium flaccumfaciens]MBT1583237.1 hypothetical protein [Curtobacterium flaccumfaciens pv. flaccumfaciens]MCX2799566.1 hypothetical protein [Curtobacterium flaccumfaciens pv. flaccumfaciens]